MGFKLFSVVSLASGALALAITLAAPAATGADAAARSQQVPPRPTLEPTAAPQPTATTAAAPQPSEREDTTPRYGHVTGTVIDQRTGSPTANVRVMVGSDMVMSDANGNYDHWLLVGRYPVTLVMDVTQGIPVQAPQQVIVSADGMATQHLFFNSPAPAAPQAAAPQAATLEPTRVAPSPSPEPMLASAPVSGPAAPDRLPTTGDDGGFPFGSLWFALILVVGGGLLSMRQVRLALLPWLANGHQRDDTGLLRALLAAHPRHRRRQPTPKADAVLLASLLDQTEDM